MSSEQSITNGISRRRLLQAMAMASAAATLPWQAIAGTPAKQRASWRDYSPRARAVVGRSLVIDMLGVLTMDDRPEAFANRISDADAAMFRECGITGFHNSYGIGGPNAYEEVMTYFAAWQGFLGRNDELFLLVDKAGDLDRAKAQGKIAVIMGVQDADHFRTPADVKTFRQIGQRCSQLTYNSQNLIGSGSTDRIDGGVSDYGVAIIKAMNESRMLVDVSHCGDKTTLDAIELSAGPIAITHSNCRALVNHPRLKTDEAIRKLAAKGGVMGITGVRMFVKGSDPTTVDDMVDHIDHVAKLVGIEHVGIGSDSDLNGYDDLPEDKLKQLRAAYKKSYAFREKIDIDGFDHPKKIFDLAEALIRKGYSDNDIGLVLGGNFRRLLGTVWG
ncbi:MAG: membrane dipeptidase [Dokdonella sp.]